MKTLKYISMIAIILLGIAACSSSNNDEDISGLQKIEGRWETYSWLNKDDEFAPLKDGSFFSFYNSKQFVYYNGEVLDKHITGKYTFDTNNNTVHCEAEKGYSFTIKIAFDSETIATFSWHYDVTPNDVTTIKVKRM